MELALRITVIIVSLLLLCYILHLVKHDRLQLRYSLIWLCLGIFMLVCAVFPAPLFAIGSFFGFATSSNFVFACVVFFLLLACLLLSSIVSKQAIAIKNLTQRLAIVERETLIIEKDVRHDL